MYTSAVHGGKYGEGYTSTSIGHGNSRNAYRRQPSQESNTYPPISMNDEYAQAREKGLKPSKTTPKAFANGSGNRKSIFDHLNRAELSRPGRAQLCIKCLLCTFAIVILVLICVAGSFVLLLDPPYVKFDGVTFPDSPFELTGQGFNFNLNLTLHIGVINPNFFGVNFDELKANVSYPSAGSNNGEPLGGGILEDLKIDKESNSTIDFPITLNYTSDSSDPAVLTDIATKCGLLGGGDAEKITINYNLTVKPNIVGVKLSIPFSSSADFDCPITADDIGGVLGDLVGGLTGGDSGGGLGGIVDGISGILGKRNLDDQDNDDNREHSSSSPYSKHNNRPNIRSHLAIKPKEPGAETG